MMVELSNEQISLQVDDGGTIRSLTDKASGQNWIRPEEAGPAFFIDAGEGAGFESGFRTYHQAIHENELEQIWETSYGTLRSSIKLDGSVLSFTSALSVKGRDTDASLVRIAYPRITGVRIPESAETDSALDTLFHPYATGVVLKNPLSVFTAEHPGFTLMPYPESFSGCPFQFMAYYQTGFGGVYFGSHDDDLHHKWLNAYREKGSLTLEHIYGYQSREDHRVTASYPVVLRLMDPKADWYQAADIYREWVGSSRLMPDSKRSNWLKTDMGAATFGINARYDRSKFIHRLQSHLSTPLYHVVGPDWAKEGQNYYNHLCGGLEDWFPAVFSDETLQALHEHGDRFAAFQFDAITRINGADAENAKKALIRYPEAKQSLDAYSFNILCPRHPWYKELHLKRDMQLEDESGCDALYYDISWNNLLHMCFNFEHNELHRRGGDQEISQACRGLYEASREATDCLVGTEMVNEIFLGQLDYYQARSWAQPNSTLEVSALRELIRQDQMEMVPAFEYLFHDIGPVRLDGWGNLAGEGGDFFFFTLAKVYLWGGLYELNYEWTQMESLEDGSTNLSEEHYYRFENQTLKFDEAKAAYLDRWAKLRLSPQGQMFLGHGCMLRPPLVKSAKYSYQYYNYNAPKGSPEYAVHEVFEAPSVVVSRWAASRDKNAKEAIFIANATAMNQTVELELQEEWGSTKRDIILELSPYELRVLESET